MLHLRLIDHRVGGSTVGVVGELTEETAAAFRHEIGDRLYPSRDLCLDLSGVSLLTTGGLDALVCVGRRYEAAGGRLTLVGASGLVRRVLDLTGVTVEFGLAAQVDAPAD